MIALPRYELCLPQPVARRVRECGYRFLVTGARGWLGRASLDLLESALGPDLTSRVVAFGSSSGTLRTRGGSEIPVLEFAAAKALARQRTLLLHYAYLTKDRLAGLPVEIYRQRNAEIRDTVKGWVGLVGVVGMFLPSSGAVYAALGTAEDRDGRADYGRDKLEDEREFASACREQGARLLIARIFSLSGPHINKHSSYVLAAIILSILRGEPVALRAQRPVFRSFVAAADLVCVALAWLLSENRPEQLTIDAASDEIIEIGELARRAVAAIGRQGTAIKRPEIDPRDPDRYVGDASQLAGLASRLGVQLSSMDQQISDTAAYLAESAGAAGHG